MLSINIPVYNIDVDNLVSQLIDQAKKLEIEFEIRVYDDGSKEALKTKNRSIAALSNVVYLELDKNMGRSAIRNKMGIESKFKYLLFIDADSKIVKPDYLDLYLKNVQKNRVLCGGTIYQKTKPTEPEKYLRWFYGTKREAVSAETRNSKKGFIITSNNFLIEKELFAQIHFCENIKHYGHEDTLLGFDLFQKKIDILHINNPVEHTGLENSEVFLEKTKTALKNLHIIVSEVLVGDEAFKNQVHFLNKYSKLLSLFPAVFFRFIFGIGERAMKKNLLGKNPKLAYFDLYKICFYSTLK